MIPVVKVIESGHFKKLGGAKKPGCPLPRDAEKSSPPAAPSPKGGQGVQGVSNGRVMIVAHTHVGPEIKFFPLGSPNKFWGARFCSGAGQPPRATG